MASINAITGKEMVSKAATDDYRIGHERIFGKKGAQSAEEQKVCEACRNTGAIHCSDPVNCGGPWSDPLPEPVHDKAHKFWGAGEPDCPADIKAPNGELTVLRCKRCNQEKPFSNVCPGRPLGDCVVSQLSSRACERGTKGCDVRHTNSVTDEAMANLSHEQLLEALLTSSKEDADIGLVTSNETDALKARVLKRMSASRNDRAVYSAMADNYNNDRAKASEGRR